MSMAMSGTRRGLLAFEVASLGSKIRAEEPNKTKTVADRKHIKVNEDYELRY